MWKNAMVVGAALLSILAALPGCGQEVEVTGEVKSATALDGPIWLDFYDDRYDELLSSTSLEQLGSFQHPVDVCGDAFIVDAHWRQDGGCIQAWAGRIVTVRDDGTTEPVTLDLVPTDTFCPPER